MSQIDKSLQRIARLPADRLPLPTTSTDRPTTSTALYQYLCTRLTSVNFVRSSLLTSPLRVYRSARLSLCALRATLHDLQLRAAVWTSISNDLIACDSVATDSVLFSGASQRGRRLELDLNA